MAKGICRRQRYRPWRYRDCGRRRVHCPGGGRYQFIENRWIVQPLSSAVAELGSLDRVHMPMKTYSSLFFLGYLFSSLSAIAQGNLVFNGGFDSSAAGWVTNVSSGYYNPWKGNPGGCFDLAGSISQTISNLSPGASYFVSGSYDVAGGTLVSTPSFGVTINGNIEFEVAPLDYNWHGFNFSYTATSSSALLSLEAQIHGIGLGYRIDNILMQPLPKLAGNVAGTNIVLTWSTNVVGFVLQASTNFLSTTNWLNVTNSVAVVGSNRTVTVSATRPGQYFRLKL